MPSIRFKKLHRRYVLTEDYLHPPGPIDGFDDVTGEIRRTRDGLLLVDIRGGVLRICREYAWNGPSGPTLHTSDAMRGSLVHDTLYQITRELVRPGSDAEWDRRRHAADREFKRILDEDGMPWWRRNLWYRVLRIFGRWYIRT